MPAGRPSKYKTEYTELAYNYALLGATDKDLAVFFDTTEQTINAWKEAYPEFLESLKRGKGIADAKVAQSLYHRAIGYEHPETITAAYQGIIMDTREVVKHYAPDPTAAIFWLKNRQPEKWRDKQDIESKVSSENINHNINYDDSAAAFMRNCTPDERQRFLDGDMTDKEKEQIAARK